MFLRTKLWWNFKFWNKWYFECNDCLNTIISTN